MAALYRIDIPIRFRHCDPAGIVFYPRYFEIFNEVIEDWFEHALDCSFGYMMEQGAGMPLVNVDSEFFKTSRLGDLLNFQLRVLEVGRSSINICLEAFRHQEKILTARMVLVYTQKTGDNDYASAPLPERVKERIRRYC